MHLLIPFAAAPGPQCQAALATLHLPHLAQLLHLLTPGPRVDGSADSLTPLHEHLHARSLGWPSAGDGLLPWAAHEAQALGLAQRLGPHGWAWITPCHWRIETDGVTMEDPDALALSADESDVLRRAMQAYFAEDGITLHPSRASTWLAQGAVFQDLPTASLARVCGNRVDGWMPRNPAARSLRRLQNEMQMLLYRLPLNDARAQQRRPLVNSFWVSGTGTLPEPAIPPQAPPPTQPPQPMALHADLQAPALRDDAPAWVQAWQQLDARVLAELLDHLRAAARSTASTTSLAPSLALTLCGPTGACTWAATPAPPWWERLTRTLRRRWHPVHPTAVLGTL